MSSLTSPPLSSTPFPRSPSGRPERYLVTGGAGFIGSHIVARLLAGGASVRVFDDESSGDFGRLDGLAGDLERVRGDIRDAAALGRATAGVDRVFHQAADVSVPRSVEDPATTYAVNVTGTLNVLEAARAAGVRRVVMASSSAVYGDDPEMPKREGMAPRPISPYASSKLADEGLCEVYLRCYGLETVALRYFNVYGPGQDPSSPYAAVIPKFVEAIAAGRRPVIFGDGEQTRDFVYVGDVVEANLLAMAAAGAPGRSFNIASGGGISLNRMLGVMGDVYGRALTAEHQPERAGDVKHSLADPGLAAEVIGFRATTPFAEGLRRTLAAGIGGERGPAAEWAPVAVADERYAGVA